MIRDMVRPTLPRKLITVLVIGSLAFMNVPRVQASAPPEQERATLAPATPTAVVPDLAAARTLLTDLIKSADPDKVALGKRMSVWLDIASAKTRAERHAAIQKLPVTVRVAASKDGAGLVKTFVAGGKVRASRMIPAPVPTLPNTRLESDEEQTGGPRVPVDLDGRWKSDGNGGCYWDASDSGPDQCAPPGRWKDDGNGGCYWDANDSGPYQCTPPNPPPPDTCWFDGAPADCATQQDRDDALALAAAAADEVEQAQSDADADYAAIEAYCNQNPWDCGEHSGPNVGGLCKDFPCSADFYNFAGAAVTTNGSIIGLVAIATAPVSVPALAIVGAGLVVVGGLLWMRSAGTGLRNCKAALVR
jgi:hypothetical protein